MLFRVIGYRQDYRISEAGVCYLVRDGWDDYNYKTTFQLAYLDVSGKRFDFGDVKIVLQGMGAGSVAVPDSFETLGENYASLGSGQDYYESLMKLSDGNRLDILIGLRDVAWDEARFIRFRSDHAFATSAMRSVGDSFVRKFANILRGRSENTPFHFTYTLPNPSSTRLEFVVTPYTLPPTNIHVIIGRNGIGKTTLLKNLTMVLEDPVAAGAERGSFAFNNDLSSSNASEFANLVTVAFSAFDEFPKPREDAGGLKYSYVGLRDFAATSSGGRGMKSPADLEEDFVKSTLSCLKNTREERWRSTIQILETDGILANLGITRLLSVAEPDRDSFIRQLFRDASSGHKIVLLAMTKLVELVDERTLVLIDEPEAHLHPPLQGAFIRALSALLAQRNGVAILATHSPVMLQEVPSSCTWLMFREGEARANRPALETFGENLSVLTREVFRYELTESGFYTLLHQVATSAESPEETVAAFGEHLGMEGRAIARALWRSIHDA